MAPMCHVWFSKTWLAYWPSYHLCYWNFITYTLLNSVRNISMTLNLCLKTKLKTAAAAILNSCGYFWHIADIMLSRCTCHTEERWSYMTWRRRLPRACRKVDFRSWWQRQPARRSLARSILSTTWQTSVRSTTCGSTSTYVVLYVHRMPSVMLSFHVVRATLGAWRFLIKNQKIGTRQVTQLMHHSSVNDYILKCCGLNDSLCLRISQKKYYLLLFGVFTFWWTVCFIGYVR